MRSSLIPRPNLAAANSFLHQVLPHGLPITGRQLVFRKSGSKSRFHDRIDEAAVEATKMAADTDIYFGVGLRRPGLKSNRRGRNEDVLFLPGFCADLDAAKPGNSKRYPPTKSAVAEIVSRMPVQPTLLWDSGGGLQALWLFEQLWDLTDRNERAIAAAACREFGRVVHDHFVQAGYTADFASDLARHLRLPGTIHHGITALVTVVEDRSENRYLDWRQILGAFGRDLTAISQANPAVEFNRKRASTAVESLTTATTSIAASDPEIARLLSGDLSNPDPSKGDWRLSKLLEAHGVSEAQRKAAISERRLHIPLHAEKAYNQDYLNRTASGDQTVNGGSKYIPTLLASSPHRLQMLDAALHHTRDWYEAERLTPTHALLLCELAGWCKQGVIVTVAVDVLAKNLHLSRQRVSRLLRDLRSAGCISFDPAFTAARNRLRPIMLFVVEEHSKHVNSALPVQSTNMSNGLYVSPSEHVNPALPKSSQGGGRQA